MAVVASSQHADMIHLTFAWTGSSVRNLANGLQYTIHQIFLTYLSQDTSISIKIPPLDHPDTTYEYPFTCALYNKERQESSSQEKCILSLPIEILSQLKVSVVSQEPSHLSFKAPLGSSLYKKKATRCLYLNCEQPRRYNPGSIYRLWLSTDAFLSVRAVIKKVPTENASMLCTISPTVSREEKKLIECQEELMRHLYPIFLTLLNPYLNRISKEIDKIKYFPEVARVPSHQNLFDSLHTHIQKLQPPVLDHFLTHVRSILSPEERSHWHTHSRCAQFEWEAGQKKIIHYCATRTPDALNQIIDDTVAFMIKGIASKDLSRFTHEQTAACKRYCYSLHRKSMEKKPLPHL